ncbi:type IV secretion system protein VirB4 [Celeribacter marinus]|uniref:ATPase required for both assembly of type IV secretion complex and secretion of T-DNA complex, VirB4 n=1 Tax=Celeribacter marinus TaxID=1397108 RepID=A0A0N9ZRX7_9RHOB|nr:ATPase required for both assembly of type IV secretion complex and secretion of T-DNA complex, VirB4 [Celeribacter marinus]SFK59517.1 type IV secretion system protein VirB4 [Celeribacter marinus]
MTEGLSLDGLCADLPPDQKVLRLLSDLVEWIQEWTAAGRYGWIFGPSPENTFSLDGDVVGFDLTGILDSESEKERIAVLSYLCRRMERVIEELIPTLIIIYEACKELDNPDFSNRLSNWLATAHKQNAIIVTMPQYASQLERPRTGKAMLEALPTQLLPPNLNMTQILHDGTF